jgi:hypothetical protein
VHATGARGAALAHRQCRVRRAAPDKRFEFQGQPCKNVVPEIESTQPLKVPKIHFLFFDPASAAEVSLAGWQIGGSTQRRWDPWPGVGKSDNKHIQRPSHAPGWMRKHAPAPVLQDGAKVMVTTVTKTTGGPGKRARRRTQRHLGTVRECCREQWKVKLDQCDERQPCNGCEECVFIVDSSSDSW